MSDEPMTPTECNTCGGTGELAAHLGGVQTLAADLCPDCNPEARIYAEAKKRGMEIAERFESGAPAVSIGEGILAMAEESDFLEPEPVDQYTVRTSERYENVKPSQTVHTVSPEVGEVLQAQAKRIADLEVMNEAQRTLTANAVADVERQQAGERARRIELEQVSRARKWAIDALIEALVPFASFASEEDGNIRGMTEPVCLSMAAVRRADALVKLHQALR